MSDTTTHTNNRKPICGRSGCEATPSGNRLYCEQHDPPPFRQAKEEKPVDKPAYVKPAFCTTVGEIIAHLQKFPPDFPVAQSGDPGVIVVHYNASKDDAHVAFEEDNGCWDDVPGARGSRDEDDGDEDDGDEDDE